MIDQCESGPLQNFGRFEVHRGSAPNQLHQFDNDIRQAEGDQELGHMPKFVDLAQTQTLEQSAQATDDDRGQHQGRPKPREFCDAVTHVRAQHIKRGMRKIQHTHHAENQGQPGAQHKKQQAITQTVEHGNDEKLHRGRPSG